MVKNKFILNLSTTLFSQIFIMLVSVFLSFILPKFLSLNDYSLWQVFVFYSSYTGVFLLGINDGFIIKNAGKNYEDLSLKTISFKFYLSFLLELILGIIICIIIIIFNIRSRLFIYISLVIYMIFQNSFALLGSYHQATNNNKLYSKACVFERIIFLLISGILLLFKLNNYFYFIIINLISIFLTMIYLFFKSKLLITLNISNIKKEFIDLFSDMQIGFKVMIANLSGTLIMGGCRMIIDNNWDVTMFGKVSLAISMLQLFLTFVNKAGIVLFPAMKSISLKKNKEIFKILYFLLVIITPLLLICYFPFKFLITIWLTNYIESIQFFSILIIVCIFESKMNLIYSTYLKMFRQENIYLLFNFLSAIIFLILSVLTLVFSLGIYILLLTVIISLSIRDLLSGFYILHRIDISSKFETIEYLIILLYLFLSLYVKNDLIVLFFMIVFTTLYFLYLKKEIIYIFNIIKKKGI